MFWFAVGKRGLSSLWGDKNAQEFSLFASVIVFFRRRRDSTSSPDVITHSHCGIWTITLPRCCCSEIRGFLAWGKFSMNLMKLKEDKVTGRLGGSLLFSQLSVLLGSARPAPLHCPCCRSLALTLLPAPSRRNFMGMSLVTGGHQTSYAPGTEGRRE